VFIWLFTILWHQHGFAGQDKVVVSVSEAVMRSAPGFLSKAIAKVPYGTPVKDFGARQWLGQHCCRQKVQVGSKDLPCRKLNTF